MPSTESIFILKKALKDWMLMKDKPACSFITPLFWKYLQHAPEVVCACVFVSAVRSHGITGCHLQSPHLDDMLALLMDLVAQNPVMTHYNLRHIQHITGQGASWACSCQALSILITSQHQGLITLL